MEMTIKGKDLYKLLGWLSPIKISLIETDNVPLNAVNMVINTRNRVYYEVLNLKLKDDQVEKNHSTIVSNN